MRTEIILVGDELLEDQRGVQPAYLGDLVSALAHDIETSGGSLGRLSIVGDGKGELAPILANAADRGVALVVIIGGLGPTHDDRVRDEVATALGGGPPEPHPDAMAWLTEAYESKGIAVPGRGGGWERMGHCPPGAIPLRNPAGMACGLAFRLGQATEVRCLPGVTYEALPMWRDEVLPGLRARWGDLGVRGEATVLVRGVREGLVAPIVEAFIASMPTLRAGVYLSDLVDGRFRAIRVTLRGSPGDVETALPRLEEALGAIQGAQVVRGDELETEQEAGRANGRGGGGDTNGRD